MPHTILSSLSQRDDATDDEFIPESVSITVLSESDSDSRSLHGDKHDLNDEPHQLKTGGKRKAVSSAQLVGRRHVLMMSPPQLSGSD
jgi:hypothetical protein